MEADKTNIVKVDKPLEDLQPGEYVDMLEGSPVRNEIERRKKQASMKPTDIIKSEIKHIQDFPTKGVDFVDLTPVFEDSTAFNALVSQLFLLKKTSDFVLSPEARGFVIGGAIASVAGSGFILLRKKGKLPQETYEISFTKEYGSDTLYVNKERIDLMQSMNQQVVIVDDVLATGGTALAIAKFCLEHGIIVKQFIFAVEIQSLGGRKLLEYFIKENKLLDVRVDSLIVL